MSKSSLGRRRFLKSALAATAAGAVGSTAGALLAGPAVPAAGSPLAEAAEPGVPQVPKNVLGRTGIRIPRLVLGTAMDFNMGLLKHAVGQGITYFDTADCYGGGQSEKTVGQFVERSGLRKQLWITTKSDMHDPGGLERQLAQSLERLKTDYVDLLFLHNLGDLGNLSSAMRQTAERLKKSGKIRFFGFSTHNPNVAEALTAASTLGWIDAIMFKYNFRAYGDSELNRAIDAAKKASIGLIAMKTQGSAFSFQNRVDGFMTKGFTQHQAVLKAVWNDDRIDAAVSEMGNVQQIDQNATAARDLTRLGAAVLDDLQRYARETSHLYCRGCEHLCGAALARPVAVADTLRLLMYHDEYGARARSKRLFSELPPERRAIEGLDLEPARKACPHDLDVAALLQRAHKVLKA